MGMSWLQSDAMPVQPPLVGHDARPVPMVGPSARHEKCSLPKNADGSGAAGELSGEVHDILTVWGPARRSKLLGAEPMVLLAVIQLSILAGSISAKLVTLTEKQIELPQLVSLSKDRIAYQIPCAMLGGSYREFPGCRELNDKLPDCVRTLIIGLC